MSYFIDRHTCSMYVLAHDMVVYFNFSKIDQIYVEKHNKPTKSHMSFVNLNQNYSNDTRTAFFLIYLLNKYVNKQIKKYNSYST